MSTTINLEKEVKILDLNHTIPPEITYFYKQIGKIRGIKTLQNNNSIFLIEFKNHDRIWILQKELKFL